MIRYFCDKCRKELKEDCDIFQVKVDPPEYKRWSDDAMTGAYILCRDCAREHYEWLHNPVEGETDK